MRATRLVVPVALAAVALAVWPSGALAHTWLVRAEPADGGSLAHAPRELRLHFSEPIRPGFTRIVLQDLSGRKIATGSPRVTGRDAIVRLPALRRDTYSVDWTTLSVDGHLSSGVSVFAVGMHVAPAGNAGSAGTRPAEVVLRWLLLTSMSVLVGTLAIVAFVLPAASRRARQRALALAALCAALATVVGMALFAWQISELQRVAAGSTASTAWRVADTNWGAVWLARELLLLVLLAIVVRLRRSAESPGALALAAAAPLLFAQALSGHANGGQSSRGLAIVADAAHLAGASIWIGGLVTLVIALHGEPRPSAVGCWKRFGVLAAAGVGTLAVSGLYLAGREVASPDALVGTLYGKTLLAKTLLFLGAGMVGFTSALALHRAPAARFARLLRRPEGWVPVGRRQLARLVLVEAIAGLFVLLGAGLLTASPPARGPAWSPAAALPRSSAAGTSGDLLVALSIKPNRPGANVYDVRVVSTRRPAPATVRRVRLELVSADGRTMRPGPLRKIGSDRYRVGGDELVREGRWRIAAAVERPGMPTVRLDFAWQVAGATPPRRVVLSDRPLGPFLTWMAGIAGAALLLGAGLAWLRVWGQSPRRLSMPPAEGKAS